MEIREYSETGELSSRLDRLYAASVDWLLAAIFPVFALLGGFSWIAKVVVASARSGQPPGPDARPEGPLLTLLVGCAAAGLLLALVQCWGLAVRGQTIGKRLLGIQIVDQYDRPAGFLRALLLRSVVFGFLVSLVQGWVGPLGALIPLVDVLFIFGPDKRCLHDYLAGTRVRNTALAHARAIPVLAVFALAAVAMGVQLAKVGVNLHLDELRQLAGQPGTPLSTLREQLSSVQGLQPEADRPQGGVAAKDPQGDVSLSPKTRGKMWKYEDASGALQFSGDYEAIPKKYRAKATPIE